MRPAPPGFERWTDRAVFGLFVAGAVVLPFPYGGITPLGTALIEIYAFVLLALALLTGASLTRLDGLGLSLLALTGIAVLGLVQWLPLPPGVVRTLSPASAAIYAQAASVLAVFGKQAPASRVSIAPGETLGTILLTLAYVALFMTSVLLLRSRRKRRLFAGVLLCGAALHVLGATAMRPFTGDVEDRLHGAFVNPNHFAGYLILILCLAFAALWREVLHARDSGAEKLERAARFEARFLRLSTRALLWGLFAAGIGLTKSRGGILVAIVITGGMTLGGLLHRRLRRERWAFGILAAGTLAAALGFAALAVRQQPILRFLASDPRDPASDLRIRLWSLSLDAWQPYPIFGSGLGTFREAFRAVQPHDLNYLVEFAHSDSLQLLVTGGIIGLLLAVTAFAVFARRLGQHWWQERAREESALALAGLGALAASVLHGLVEFNMSIPAIPATLAILLGLSWAATRDDDHSRSARSSHSSS